MAKTNKLTIYLVREKYSNFTDLLKDKKSGKVIIDTDTHFFYGYSAVNEPKWLKDFFGNKIDATHKKNMKVSGVQAVLLIKIKKRIFAITFGYGRFLLHDYVIEDRFGLKTALNSLDQNSIRNIEKRTISKNPKLSREQIAKASETSDFNIDIERDLIEAITGRSGDIRFGNVLTGKDSLVSSVKHDINSIKGYLEECLTKYNSKAYLTGFKWIDQIKHVKDASLLNSLDTKLVDEINKSSREIWMSLPEMIEWEKHAGFKYSERKKDELFSEIDLHDWLISVGTPITLDDLQNCVVTAWAEEENTPGYKWSVYRCLYAELQYRTKNYFLTDGKWYAIDQDYVKSINDYFKDVTWVDLKLPEYDKSHKDENAYNKEVAKKLKGHLLDAKNLQYGGGSSKIEFCDVLTDKKELLHVKKYSGSIPLSHLFNQGYVSGELLATDKKFREDLSAKVLNAKTQKLIPIDKIDAKNYHIVFVIINKKLTTSGKINLPFFAKVAFRRVHRTLTAFQFKVSLCAVKKTG